MSAEAQTNNTVVAEKPFFYYPGYNEEFPRRVLAGLQDGNRIQVSEAVCFPGYKPAAVTVPLRGGRKVYIIDPGIKADAFVKKDGKALAITRVRGYKDIPNGKSGETKRVYPGKQLIAEIVFTGNEVTVKILSDASAPILRRTITDLPVEGLSIGKAFVEGVEAYLEYFGFPEKPKKVKKALPEAGEREQNFTEPFVPPVG